MSETSEALLMGHSARSGMTAAVPKRGKCPLSSFPAGTSGVLT